MGIDIAIACPSKKSYAPLASVVKKAKRLAKKSSVVVTSDPLKAAKNADVVYTDSWMSYRIAGSKKKLRVKDLKKYSVTKKVMNAAKKKAIFMHCLPALRGMEVEKSVIDGKQSVVFDQAENRLHMQKALLLYLLR